MRWSCFKCNDLGPVLGITLLDIRTRYMQQRGKKVDTKSQVPSFVIGLTICICLIAFNFGKMFFEIFNESHFGEKNHNITNHPHLVFINFDFDLAKSLSIKVCLHSPLPPFIHFNAVLRFL